MTPADEFLLRQPFCLVDSSHQVSGRGPASGAVEWRCMDCPPGTPQPPSSALLGGMTYGIMGGIGIGSIFPPEYLATVQKSFGEIARDLGPILRAPIKGPE